MLWGQRRRAAISLPSLLCYEVKRSLNIEVKALLPLCNERKGKSPSLGSWCCRITQLSLSSLDY